MFKGIGASPGIALGRALVIKQSELNIERNIITNIDCEVKRFEDAISKSKKELSEVKEKAQKELGEDKAAIFESHLLVLEDPELIDKTINNIKDQKINAEYVFNYVVKMFIAIFENMKNENMRERVADIKDVSNRVLRHLLGINIVDFSSLLNEEVILISHDLTPSNIAIMNKKMVLGFLTDISGRTSHSAIMARSLEIPAIVGLNNITNEVKDGDFIVFNGDTGEVILNPSNQEIIKYKKLKLKFDEENKSLQYLIGQETKTSDGRLVELVGNIGTPKDVKGLLKNNAEGVGLYRTEFLYIDRDNFPSEEEQFESYKSVLEAMNSKPIVIRTLDIGGDKELTYLKTEKEMNPFLGYRAIRICLDRKDIFKTQLRALFKASLYGNLRIMFPMISSLEELLAVKEIVKEVKSELDEENIKYSNDVQLGMMIEVPSAALISDIFAKHVDFFSIGTNDLIQYTCAVDRMNQKISYLYNQFNPAVLRLIKMVIDNAHKEGKWAGMCGESAGDKRMIPILIGMGLDEFSMSPISILPARKLISSLSYEEMKKITDEVLKLGTAKEIEEYINKNFNY